MLATAAGFVAHNVGLMIRRRWYRFGYACVNFATPISMRDYVKAGEIDFRTLEEDARHEAVEKLGDELLEAIAAAIPVLPVSLVATVFLDSNDDALDLLEIKGRTQALIDRLEREGAYVHIPRADRDYAVTVGLAYAHAPPLRGRGGRALPRQRGRARHAAATTPTPSWHFLADTPGS